MALAPRRGRVRPRRPPPGRRDRDGARGHRREPRRRPCSSSTKPTGLQRAARDALGAEFPGALSSARLDTADCGTIRARIDAFFARELVETKLTVPYAQLGALADLRDQLQIVGQDFGEALTLTVRGTPDVVARLRARLGAFGTHRLRRSGSLVRIVTDELGAAPRYWASPPMIRSGTKGVARSVVALLLVALGCGEGSGGGMDGSDPTSGQAGHGGSTADGGQNDGSAGGGRAGNVGSGGSVGGHPAAAEASAVPELAAARVTTVAR